MSEEELFNVWFRQWQCQTWSAGRMNTDRPEPSMEWGTGFRSHMWTAWQARAALKDCACPGGQAQHLNSCVYVR